MKQIIGNRYVRLFRFESLQETNLFLSNQGNVKIISFDETFGDNYFCYVFYHSLTNERQFVLSFCSDESDEKLNFLFWEVHKIFVLDTGRFIYLINDKLNIVKSFEITSPLIGFHLTIESNLLLLEETSLKLINSEGTILKNELFDLIEDFNIEKEKLIIRSSEGEQIIIYL